MYPFRSIVVATDFGPSSSHAVQLAADLAREYGADLTLLHVIELFVAPYPITLAPDRASLDEDAQQSLDAALARVRLEVPNADGVVVYGHPAEQIFVYAEQCSVDLVVVGTHGRSGPSRWLMGSIAARVVRSCAAPVLTVHEHDDVRVGPREVSSSRARA